MRRIILLSLTFITILSAIGIFAPGTGSAQTNTAICNGVQKCLNCRADAGGLLGLPTWYKYLTPRYDASKNECVISPPDGQATKAIGPVVLAVTEILLRLGVYLAIGVIIWGGFQYQLSQGDPERTKNARTMIINALVGIVVAVLATSIVNVVGRNLH